MVRFFFLCVLFFWGFFCQRLEQCIVSDLTPATAQLRMVPFHTPFSFYTRHVSLKVQENERGPKDFPFCVVVVFADD